MLPRRLLPTGGVGAQRRRGSWSPLWNDEGETRKPYDVVVDGRTLSWEELGKALEQCEGWCFRLVIEDPVHEARTDANVIEFHSPRTRPRPGE